MGTTKEIICRIDQEQTIEEKVEKEILGEVQKIEFHNVNLQFGNKEIFQGFHTTFEAGKICDCRRIWKRKVNIDAFVDEIFDRK